MDNDFPITSDSQLWDDFREGDEMAYQKIYSHHVQSLFKYGTKFSHDHEFVKDCIQEVFVYLYVKRKSLGPTNNIKLYLFVSLKRKMVEQLKKPNSKLNVEIEDYLFNLKLETPEEITDKEVRQQREERIYQALESLSPRQKEAIYLRFINEMSYEDICTALEMNYQSVRNLIHRAIEKLRQVMNGSDMNILLFMISRKRS